jgi:hypothetical protein
MNCRVTNDGQVDVGKRSGEVSQSPCRRRHRETGDVHDLISPKGDSANAKPTPTRLRRRCHDDAGRDRLGQWRKVPTVQAGRGQLAEGRSRRQHMQECSAPLA